MSKCLNILGTNVLSRNLQANSRFVVNQGGTRSGKTYGILQLLVIKMLSEDGKVITIARKTLTALKATAMRDFFEIIRSLKIYNEANHNKTDHIYFHRNNLIEFVSLDQPQKKRGSKRDYLFMNEVNEFSYEDYTQLVLRTTGQIFMDYNPSDYYHWVFDKVLPRKDCTYIQSTYLDNLAFLPAELVKEIEYLKEQDETYWKIFGLGERAISTGLIYSNWIITSSEPESYEDSIFGLDFGFNNQTALIKISIKDGELWLKELLYESHLTNSDLINRMQDLHLNKAIIYADAAEPQRIDELKRAGFYVRPADKAVNAGIDFVKRFKFNVNKFSVNLLKELQSYKWKTDNNGNAIDEPVKFMDHALDAVRYAVYTHGRAYWMKSKKQYNTGFRRILKQSIFDGYDVNFN